MLEIIKYSIKENKESSEKMRKRKLCFGWQWWWRLQGRWMGCTGQARRDSRCRGAQRLPNRPGFGSWLWCLGYLVSLICNFLIWEMGQCPPWWIENQCDGISLVVQWLRICLSMQGTLVWSLLKENSTCLGATKPMCHNYRAHTLEPTLCTREVAAMRSLCTETRE